MSRPELLVPAADFECAELAILHGADAVYAGLGEFNLRANARNFTPETFSELIALTKKHGRKCYMVLNSMPDSGQLVSIEKILIDNKGLLPDAVIVSDPGVFRVVRLHWPHIPIHISTQTGTFNTAAIQFWKDLGVSRVILPREMTLRQIAEVSNAGIMETEVFVHGAMCMSVAGRCLISAYIDKRHANRGDCAQPCRYLYEIRPVQSDKTDHYTIEEDCGQSYILNSKDLCSLPVLPDIINTGVVSLKIEGRNKSAHYIATVTRIYRAAIDRCFDDAPYTVDPAWMRELEQLEHRPYTTGFYGGEYHLQELHQTRLAATVQIVGIVKGMLDDGRAVIDVRHPFGVGEALVLVPVNNKKTIGPVSFDQINDLQNHALERALTNRLVSVKGEQKLHIGDIIRREKV